MSNRTLRVNELLQREISDILRKRYQSESVAITIAEVRVSPDLRDARVFVSIVGDAETSTTKLRWLRSRAAAIRAEIGRRVVLKYLPKFEYVLDESVARGTRILQALDEIERPPEPIDPDGMTEEKFYPSLSADFARLLASLAGRQVAVIGHARPDGDCIGSQVALARVLATRGLDVICVNADPVPRRLLFLVEGMTFFRTDDVLKTTEDRAAVFVDCADHARAGERLKLRYPHPVAVIDHHLSNVGFAVADLVDNTSAATCEILAGVFLDNQLPVDARTAQALFTGILTDTGQFRFNSTSRRCFMLAGELVARGARPAEAGYELYERETEGKLRLLQHFLSSLRIECGGRVCIGTLPAGIFESTGSNSEDTEGLVDYARSIDGVDIGALIEIRPDGSVKASLRAKDPIYRLDLVAAQFNGGGHACAAGLNLKTGAENFHARLVAAFAARLAEVDAQKKN